MAKSQIKDVVKATPKQKVTKAVVQPVIKQRIYVGPNILGLPTYTVIESDFTAHINGFIEKCPEIGKLFVPISAMANTEKRAKEKGTLEHRHFQKVIAFEIAERKGEQ